MLANRRNIIYRYTLTDLIIIQREKSLRNCYNDSQQSMADIYTDTKPWQTLDLSDKL